MQGRLVGVTVGDTNKVTLQQNTYSFGRLSSSLNDVLEENKYFYNDNYLLEVLETNKGNRKTFDYKENSDLLIKITSNDFGPYYESYDYNDYDFLSDRGRNGNVFESYKYSFGTANSFASIETKLLKGTYQRVDYLTSEGNRVTVGEKSLTLGSTMVLR